MGNGVVCAEKFESVSASVSNDFRRWRVKVSGLRRRSEESPDFSSGLLSRNWRVVIKRRREWVESVRDGGLHIELESDKSDSTGEGGLHFGDCGESRPDGKTWWEWMGESEGESGDRKPDGGSHDKS